MFYGFRVVVFLAGTHTQNDFGEDGRKFTPIASGLCVLIETLVQT